MHERFIVTCGGVFGHYGTGDTLEEARRNWKKVGGKKKEGHYREQKFISKMPFAPNDRKANEEEADAWIGQDGSTNWVRCERVILTQE